ncbi:MAG TPA: type II toxin-antitoxin system RelE/ParE family toxin [Gallionellaceae bacterium]|nr:type II toxin-antitoxin system RelE/ParE family toxin [Gallionellaceae bacterium]
MIEIFRYQLEDGKEPVTDWLKSLKDKQAQAKIRVRIKRLEAGNFGDCDTVGEGVQELREHLGAGYRIYFGRHGKTVVILLCGGSKKSQAADIKNAKVYWEDWKRRQI